MFTNFQLRVLAIPARDCSAIVQISEPDAYSIMDIYQTLLSLGGITSLSCNNPVELLFSPNASNTPYHSLPQYIALPQYLGNLNTKMVVMESGVAWESWNQDVVLKTATLPISIIKYLTTGGSFVNQPMEAMLKTAHSFHPIQRRGLLANH